MLSLWVVPGQSTRAKARPPGTRHRAPHPGLTPDGDLFTMGNLTRGIKPPDNRATRIIGTHKHLQHDKVVAKNLKR